MKNGFDPFERRLHLQFATIGIGSKTSSEWKQILRAAGVEILSTLSNGEASAYVLSESSLFVMPTEVVLITCGKSNIVQAFEKLLESKVPALNALMYECRHPSVSNREERFASDVEMLQKFLPQTLNRVRSFHEAPCSFFKACRKETNLSFGKTLRLLMLAPASAPDAPQSKTALMKILSEFWGDIKSDDWHFQPGGYSANFLAHRASACLHYSPGSSSYVSFEVSSAATEVALVGTSVLQLFSPKEIWRVESSLSESGADLTSHSGGI